MTETLDVTKEEVSPNGWQTFDDDQAFLQHILAQKPAEEVVEVPEWHVKVLCRALNAETRIKVQVAAYDEKSRKTDFRGVFPLIILAGVYNPTTGNRVFTESHKDTLMKKPEHGAVVERLALTVLRLSSMLSSDAERVKKN